MSQSWKQTREERRCNDLFLVLSLGANYEIWGVHRANFVSHAGFDSLFSSCMNLVVNFFKVVLLNQSIQILH